MSYEDEIVEYPDTSLGPEEFEKQQQRNHDAKMRHAARREQERFNKRNKFWDGIAKLFNLNKQREAEQEAQAAKDAQMAALKKQNQSQH